LLRQRRAEEARLRELRAQRAAVAAEVADVPPLPPFPSTTQLSALFDDIEGTLAASPTEARATLAARFGPVVLTPDGDGAWMLATTLKMDPAA
jgi:hypothetical protein